jgi:hypothetical protein
MSKSVEQRPFTPLSGSFAALIMLFGGSQIFLHAVTTTWRKA